MIKFAKHNNKEYVVIDTSLQSKDVIVPIQLQINITNLAEHEKVLIYKTSNFAFNRLITLGKEKSDKVKKSWWRFW